MSAVRACTSTSRSGTSRDGGRPPVERGEIVLRGPKVFKGYWRDPEATARAFDGGWFHTGDVGVRDEDGYVFIVDRLKDMIVSGGENIAGSEVERVLYEHASVLEAAVVGRPDERWGEVPVAFVVLRAGQTATADELLGNCRDQLARFKVPREVTFLEALPRNPVRQGAQARAAGRGGRLLMRSPRRPAARRDRQANAVTGRRAGHRAGRGCSAPRPG